MAPVIDSKAPPPPPSLVHCPVYLLVVILYVVSNLFDRRCSLSSTWSVVRISPTLSATDTPPSYYRRIGYLPQPKLEGACPCRYPKPWSLLLGDFALCTATQERGLQCCDLVVVMSSSMATIGRSTAGAEREVAHVDPAKEAATEEHAGSEAARLVTLGKRKRDTEDDGCEIESDSARPQQVDQRPSSSLASPSLQGLVDVCRYEFDGSTTPPTTDVARLIRGLMDKIRPDDVGLGEELRFHEMNITGRQNPPIITCKTIFQCKNFEIAVFFLPQGTVMPLHDHPGMTVFSKILMGSAHIEGYDCIRHPRVFSGPGSSILAEKVLDHGVTEESGAWVLFPDAGGNMHRFVAGEQTHCAFLEILTPPYSPTEQRRCTFYKDIPYEPCRCAWRSGLMEARRQGGQLAWLQKIAQPRHLRIVILPYQGPTIF